MGFDFDKFDSAQFTFPTKDVPVPELKDFFSAEEKQVWVMRSLTGRELAIVNEAVETVNRTKAIIKAISSQTNEGITKGISEFINKDEETTPEDLARRLKMLELASVPPCPEHVAVKLAAFKPTIFFRLTNEIIRLTGEGAELGK